MSHPLVSLANSSEKNNEKKKGKKQEMMGKSPSIWTTSA